MFAHFEAARLDWHTNMWAKVFDFDGGMGGPPNWELASDVPPWVVADPGDGKGPLPPAERDAEPPKPPPAAASPQTPFSARAPAAVITAQQTPLGALAPDPFTHLAGAIASPRPTPASPAAGASAGPSSSGGGDRDAISYAEELVANTAASVAASADFVMAPYYAEAERRALGVVEAYADPLVESAAARAEAVKSAAAPFLESVAEARLSPPRLPAAPGRLSPAFPGRVASWDR